VAVVLASVTDVTILATILAKIVQPLVETILAEANALPAAVRRVVTSLVGAFVWMTATSFVRVLAIRAVRMIANIAPEPVKTIVAGNVPDVRGVAAAIAKAVPAHAPATAPDVLRLAPDVRDAVRAVPNLAKGHATPNAPMPAARPARAGRWGPSPQ
jgi:hypothetical protein